MLYRVEKLPLLQVVGKHRIEGYVVFYQSKRWWNIFFKKGFSHASIIIKKKGLYVWIEPSLPFTDVEVLPFGVNLKEFFPEDARFVKFSRWRTIDSVRIPYIFSVFTCVEQIKSFLGLKNPLLLTPRQLFRELK